MIRLVIYLDFPVDDGHDSGPLERRPPLLEVPPALRLAGRRLGGDVAVEVVVDVLPRPLGQLPLRPAPRGVLGQHLGAERAVAKALFWIHARFLSIWLGENTDSVVELDQTEGIVEEMASHCQLTGPVCQCPLLGRLWLWQTGRNKLKC